MGCCLFFSLLGVSNAPQLLNQKYSENDLASSQANCVGAQAGGQSQQQQPVPSYGLFSQLKEGAASLMKNVKDASAKVVETVSL